MVYTLRFFLSSKCSLFHNFNVFGSCIIHILYIYSTNTGTEYFKHGIYSPFFSLQNCSLFHNSNVFGSGIIHILYIGVLKLKKKFLCQKVKTSRQLHVSAFFLKPTLGCNLEDFLIYNLHCFQIRDSFIKIIFSILGNEI